MAHQQPGTSRRYGSHVDSEGWPLNKATTETQSPPAPLPQREGLPVTNQYDKVKVMLLTIIAGLTLIIAIGVVYWTIMLIKVQVAVGEWVNQFDQLTQTPGLGG